MQDGDAAADPDEVFAHIFGEPIVVIVLFRVLKEQFIVNVEKFFAISLADLVEVADDPANLLKIPVVCDADEAVVGGDVGRERELTAAEGAVVAFTEGWSQAGDQAHVAWGFGLHFLFVDRVVGAFVAPQAMPEFGIGFQVSPLLFERNGDGNADIAAKRLSGGVVLPADLTAVLLTDGGGEAGVEIGDVEVRFVGHERDFTSKFLLDWIGLLGGGH